MAPREKQIYNLIENHPGIQSGGVSERLNIPLPTIKRILTGMVNQKILVKHGVGAGTNYSIEHLSSVKTDLLFTLTNTERKKVFTLMSRRSYLEIKKIILIPLFAWKLPDEWSSKLITQALDIHINCRNDRGATVSQSYSIVALNDPTYFQPVFTLGNPINISPGDFWITSPTVNDYPITATIELRSSTLQIDFEVKIVYDTVLD